MEAHRQFPYPGPAAPFVRLASEFAELAGECRSWHHGEEEAETLGLLLDSTGKFLERHVDEVQIDAQKHIPPAVLSRAGELGLFGLTIPTAYGGAGLSFKATCRVIDYVSRWDRSLGVTLGLHAGLGLRGLLAYGGEKLKQRYLPRLASGEWIACFPVTEPQAGSDIASLRTSAHEDGDELVITGSKIYATNAGFAAVATLVARTPGLGGARRGHSMILVPLNASGVERGAEENKLGIRGSSTRSLHFDGVRVGRDHLLGIPARGLDQLAYVLTWGRTIMAGGCLGLARRARQLALAQANQRQQFGRPLGQFGMVQQMLARASWQVLVMESILQLVTSLERRRPASVVWESSVAKIFCSEATWQIVDDCLQLHGGSGFIEDTGIARLLRDARISRIFEGANEVLRYHLAVGLIGQRTPLGESLATLAPKQVPDPWWQPLGQQARRLDEAVAGLKSRYGLQLVHRQMNLRCVADAALALYLQLALLARCAGAAAAGDSLDEPLVELAFEQLQHLCDRALAVVDSASFDKQARVALSCLQEQC